MPDSRSTAHAPIPRPAGAEPVLMDDARARQASADGKVNRVQLKDLLLDDTNPRFGLQDRGAGQERILDLIVEKFGVNDVLSSLAVNGYFDAEPLVCRRTPDSRKVVVVEGNRRLAACLIITGDRRASNQARRSANFSTLWNDHGRRPIDPVPAITFAAGEEEQETAILSYRGVRHFASAQPWDSYAKAAWVARVVEENALDVCGVSKMLGDRHRTVNRMLEGYHLVQQLSRTGHFNQTGQHPARQGQRRVLSVLLGLHGARIRDGQGFSGTGRWRRTTGSGGRRQSRQGIASASVHVRRRVPGAQRRHRRLSAVG